MIEIPKVKLSSQQTPGQVRQRTGILRLFYSHIAQVRVERDYMSIAELSEQKADTTTGPGDEDSTKRRNSVYI